MTDPKTAAQFVGFLRKAAIDVVLLFALRLGTTLKGRGGGERHGQPERD